MKNILRRRLNLALQQAKHGRAVKCARTLHMLGCSMDFFMQYIEQQFQPEMTWQNHGQWHIDRRVPCAAFDLTDAEQQKICFYFSNMQPLCPETSPTNMHTPAVQIPKTSPTNMHMHPLAPIAVTAPQHQRFLLFRDGGRGQGIGNIMNGLLATHLLALSYNRTCCVSHWPSFAKAFTRIPAAACAGVSEATMIKHLSLWNFGSGQVDKKCWRSGGSCDVLMQSDEVFLEITGNEYPFEIFPQLPVGLFESLYTPSELLVSYFKLQAP